MPSEPSSFILSLPKAELHLHLEGSIEPTTLLELRQRHGMAGASLAEVEQLYNYKDFAGFLTAFKDVTGHLRTPDDYELITYRLMERRKRKNILNAAQARDVIEELVESQVPIEICVTSNLRTGCCTELAQHPVRRYFDQGLMLTLNTDDPAMFRTSLVEEYALVQEAFGFTDEHLRELARNSFEASFLPPEKKIEFLNLFDAAATRA